MGRGWHRREGEEEGGGARLQQAVCDVIVVVAKFWAVLSFLLSSLLLPPAREGRDGRCQWAFCTALVVFSTRCHGILGHATD